MPSVSSSGFLLNRSDVAALCHLPHLKEIASNRNAATEAWSGEPQYVHTYAGEAPPVSAEGQWARRRAEAAVQRLKRAAIKLPWTAGADDDWSLLCLPRCFCSHAQGGFIDVTVESLAAGLSNAPQVCPSAIGNKCALLESRYYLKMDVLLSL